MPLRHPLKRIGTTSGHCKYGSVFTFQKSKLDNRTNFTCRWGDVIVKKLNSYRVTYCSKK